MEGVGHFEPLRHYAEVHILLEPLPAGSGLRFDAACSEDVLDRNWQRLILTHLMEKPHRGALTGSPITDMKLTLVAGKAHEKHTEGGDFRQATYRAVRQGLMQAESLLLEPHYDFTLELPPDCVGRAMTDIQSMGGSVEGPEQEGELSILTGHAPVAGLRDYWREVTAYTRGRGRLSCVTGRYRPCADQESVVKEMGYDPERDVENPASSVFCSHGAGHEVPWNEVEKHMHLPAWQGDKSQEDKQGGGVLSHALSQPRHSYTGASIERDKELMGIFEKTYGAVRPRSFDAPPKPRRTSMDDGPVELKMAESGRPEYLLVDGYNMIFAWEELKALAGCGSFEDAFVALAGEGAAS